MKNKQIIGVIGGMGPEASEKFYGLLIRHAQKNFGISKNEDFPEIFLDSVPVPDFIASESREKEALDMLMQRVKLMDQLPITFFCMACNTGHLLLPELRRATSKSFVSLLEDVPRVLKRNRIRKIGLLGTPTTLKTGLYQKPLETMGIEVIAPTNGDREMLGEIIFETIAGKNIEKNQIIVQQIARRLLDRGAEGILESCTEIPIIFPKQHLVPVFDTLEILAFAVLKRYYKEVL